MVKSNPFNPRAVYTSTAVDAMAESLKITGQRISATAYLNEQGGVTLIEGETRLRGARSAGLPTLRIEFRPRPSSDRSLYEEARAANVERRDQTPLDDALKWKELLSRKVYPTQVALAKALGLSEDYVSRTLALANLSSRVIHTVAENSDLLNHKMLNAIREYWEVLGDESTLELILEVAKNGLGYRDVTSRRKAAEKGPVKRPRATREVLRYLGAKGELKTFEEEGRMEFTIKGLSAEAAKELTAKLMELFPKV
jgi:ParB family chromosome partitioning protein